MLWLVRFYKFFFFRPEKILFFQFTELFSFANVFCVFSAANVTHKKFSNHIIQNETVNGIEDVKIDFYHLNSDELLEKRIQFRQRRGPCACVDLNCGCCAGMNMQQFNIKRIRKL